MSPEPDAFDFFSSGALSESAGAGRLPAVFPRSEPGYAGGDAASLAELRKKVQALSQQNADLLQQLAASQQQLAGAQRMLEEEKRANQVLQSLRLSEASPVGATSPERIARQVAKSLYQIVPCDAGLIWMYQPAEGRYKLVSTTGSMAYLIPGNIQPDVQLPAVQSALERGAAVQGDGPRINGQGFSTCLVMPIARTATVEAAGAEAAGAVAAGAVAAGAEAAGEIYGLILLARQSKRHFDPLAVRAVETAAAEILAAWRMARPYDVLSDFVQAITTFSAVQGTGSLMERIADTARTALNARFAVVATQMQQEWKLRSSGTAPRTMAALEGDAWPFLEAALRSPYTFRIRDLRADERAAVIDLDEPELRSLLCSPIRINGANAGVLLVFGKHDADGFSDFDVFLAEKLAAHAAINLDSCYLNQELRESLKTTRLLYDLSQQMASAEALNEAAWLIARTAYKLYHPEQCGLVLYGLGGQDKVAEACLPAGSPAVLSPEEMIQQAMDSREMILVSETDGSTRMVVPVKSKRLCYGALWLVLAGGSDSPSCAADEIQALASQAAVAVERTFLLQETRSQARALEQANSRLELANFQLRDQAGELERAFTELEGSYDKTIQALTRALDARDRETENHSVRVTEMSVWLGQKIGLPAEEIKALRRGAMLHDLGKLGIRDHVLLKPGRLTEEEWLQMRQHPEKGVEIIKEIAPLGDAIPVIIAHQERWNGNGYPSHLKGEEIPLLARLFAVIDVYDALTSNRPYRQKSSKEEVLQYLESQSGTDFDPQIVATFTHLMRTDPPQGEE